jgi:hypothetical protein
MLNNQYLLNSDKWKIKTVEEKYVVYREATTTTSYEEYTLDTYKYAELLQKFCNGIEKPVDYSSFPITGSVDLGIGVKSRYCSTVYKDARFNKPLIVFNTDSYSFQVEYINVPALLNIWLNSTTLMKTLKKTLKTFSLSKLLKVIWYGENGSKK